MAVPIIPRVIRGRLYFQSVDILLPTFVQAGNDRQATHSGGAT